MMMMGKDLKSIAGCVQSKMVRSIMRLNAINSDGTRAGKRTPWATAMLAKLRRAVGSEPGEYSDIWEVTLSEGEGNGQAEWALHTALTLFALHQQGSIESVSADGVSFGKAMQQIYAKDNNKEQGVIRRFNSLATADSLSEFAHHARGVIQLMKQEGITMDYPSFAKDLFWYQQIATVRNKTRMQWGRDFYRHNKEENDNE